MEILHYTKKHNEFRKKIVLFPEKRLFPMQVSGKKR